MKSNNRVALSLSLVMTAGIALVGGKTAAEWFREYQSVVLTLTDEGQKAAESKDKGTEAISAAAQAGEAAALAEFEKGIANACAAANEMATWIEQEGYLKDCEGFEKILGLVDAAIKYVRAPHNPKSTLAADRVMKNINKAALVLSAGLEWLRANRCVRNEARDARNDIEKLFCRYFKKNPVPEAAKEEYEVGIEELKHGKELFARSDFAEALKCFTKSREMLASARSRAVVLADAPVPVDVPNPAK